jgi:hypothetical protein
MTKPNFRPISPLDVDDDALERVNQRLGVPTMVRPVSKASQTDGATASRQPVAPPRRQQKLTVRIPGYLVDALKQKALDQRTTVRNLVLLALQKDGYTVEPADLLPGAGGSD